VSGNVYRVDESAKAGLSMLRLRQWMPGLGHADGLVNERTWPINRPRINLVVLDPVLEA
jgi:hypothetical protein